MEMTPGGIFKAIRDPLGTAWDMAKNAVNPDELVKDANFVQTVTGLAGRSILIDPTKEAAEMVKNPKGAKQDFLSTIVHFLKKRVATWGVLAGIIAGITSLVAGKVQRSSENPNPLLGTVVMAARALIFAGPAASVWGQVMKNVEKVANVDPSVALKGQGNEIIEKLNLAPTRSLADLNKSIEEQPFAFNPDENSEAERIIGNVSTQPVKCIVVSEGGSGGEQLLDRIAKEIIEAESKNPSGPREVVVQKINCVEVLQKLLYNSQGQSDDFKKEISGFLSKLTGGTVSLSGHHFSSPVVYGIQQRIDIAKSQNQRLVIELTNVDSLWALARGANGQVDYRLVEAIIDGLSGLLHKGNNYDVLVTSNQPHETVFGLSTVYNAEQVKALNEAHIPDALINVLNELQQNETLKIALPSNNVRAKIIALMLTKDLQITNKQDEVGKLAKRIEKKINEQFKDSRNKIIAEIKTNIKLSSEKNEDFDFEEELNKIRQLHREERRFNSLKQEQVSRAITEVIKNTFVNEVNAHGINSTETDSLIKEKILPALIGQSIGLTQEDNEHANEQVTKLRNELQAEKNNIILRQQEKDKTYTEDQEKLKNLRIKHSTKISDMLKLDDNKLSETISNPINQDVIRMMIRDFDNLDSTNPKIIEDPLFIQFHKLLDKIYIR